MSTTLYSKEEINSLLDVMDTNNLSLSFGWKEIIKGWGSKGILNDPSIIFKVFPDDYSKEFSEVINLPYDQLPLHINDSNKVSRIVVQWRLEIGK